MSANTTNYIASTAPEGSLNSVKLDTNDDGEIQVSEASVITQLSVYNQNISSLEGIAGFSNLFSLTCSYNTISSLNLSGLSHLNTLHSEYNGMTSLTMPPNMRWIYCNNNALTSLDLSAMLPVCTLKCDQNFLQQIVFPNYDYLITMDCSYNQLSSIDLSHLHEAGNISLNNNNLTSIVFNNPNHTFFNEFSFDCSNNPLVHLDMTGLRSSSVNSEILKINNTLLTEITIPSANFKYYQIHDNPTLEFLNVKGCGNFQSFSDCDDCGIQMSNNPQLHAVCVNDAIPHTYLQSILNNPNIVYTSYCSFTPGGDFNTVSGAIKFDNDANGCDVADLPAISIPVKITQGTTLLGRSYTATDGNYAAYTTFGNIKLTPEFENPYYTIIPATFTSTFTGFGNSQTC